MGMSASQVRLLSMTARIHDIENAAQRIQNQKMLLANQSDEAYEEYLDALSKKNIQFTSFDPATGGFQWEEMTLNELFNNGYRLNVRNILGGYRLETVSTTTTRATGTGLVNQTLLQNELSELYTPAAGSLVYTSTALPFSPSLAGGGSLNDIYTATPLGANGMVADITPGYTEEDLQGYTKIYENMPLEEILTNDTDNMFYIDDQGAFDYFINQMSNETSLAYEGCTIILAGDFIATEQLIQFNGVLDGNGHTLTLACGGSFIGTANHAGCTISNLVVQGGNNSNLINDIGTCEINNCKILDVQSGAIGAIANNVIADSTVNINNTYVLSSLPESSASVINASEPCNIYFSNSYFIDNNNGNTGFVDATSDAVKVNFDNSYTTASYLVNNASIESNTNSFSTENNNLTITIIKSGSGVPFESTITLTKDMNANDIIEALNNQIAQHDCPPDSVTINNGCFTIAMEGFNIDGTSPVSLVYNASTPSNTSVPVTPSITGLTLNMLDQLGLNSFTTTDNSSTLQLNGNFSFNIFENTSVLESCTIPLTNNATPQEIIDAIETILHNHAETSNATVSIEDGRLVITIPNNGNNSYSVGSFTETVPNYIPNDESARILDILGLNSVSAVQSVEEVQIQIPIEDEFYMCSSTADVMSILGNNINLNSPELLRELVYNSMAIIMRPTNETTESGDHVYEETSVAVDTHLREMQNETDMAIAEANYEAALRKIDQKDKKYDKELAAMDSERNAIKSEFETLKTCIKENVDRTFKIFQG